MYLNNAGAAITSDVTQNIIIDYLNLERKIGAYEAANLSKIKIQEFYKEAALSINAENSNEIAYVDSASRGWNLAIEGLTIKEGDQILTFSSEFGTNLITLYKKAKACNAELKILDCGYDGDFDLGEIEILLKSGVRVIAISHAIAHGSIINPVYEIGKLASKYGATYIVDGCQSIGNINVDVQRMKCDAFIATGRKWLRGPRGTGFLYVRKGSKIKTSQLDLSSSDLILDKNGIIIGLEIVKEAKKFELWERNVAALLGLTNAIKENNDIIKTSKFKQKELYANEVRNAISSNKKFKIIGSINSETGVCGFFTENPNFEDSLTNIFKNIGLNVSKMSDWDCPLHFPRNGVKSIFRISPHYYTQKDSINLVINEILNF